MDTSQNQLAPSASLILVRETTAQQEEDNRSVDTKQAAGGNGEHDVLVENALPKKQKTHKYNTDIVLSIPVTENQQPFTVVHVCQLSQSVVQQVDVI